MSVTKKRPRFEFLASHPQHTTHLIKVRSPQQRLVVVPVGPSIPRRDKPEVYERYCRCMLLFFKPWRIPSDLRKPSQSWSAAFEEFKATCPDDKCHLMNNMQLHHECRDSRDD
ncbi:hypothetical protein K435DRAFT_704153, partial [Dendrothele bispora CBS 962.96]